MKIDVFKDFYDKDRKEELRRYLMSVEGARWRETLYGDGRITMRQDYMQPFIESASAGIEDLVASYEGDWWNGAVASVDFFRSKFKISIPIELLIDASSPYEIVYSFATRKRGWRHCDLLVSEIVIGDLTKFPPYGPPATDLACAIAHEVWHAVQLDARIKYLQRHGSTLNLERIDPTKARNIGAVYFISELLYKDVYNEVEYRRQIIESEALWLQHRLTLILEGRLHPAI